MTDDSDMNDIQGACYVIRMAALVILAIILYELLMISDIKVIEIDREGLNSCANATLEQLNATCLLRPILDARQQRFVNCENGTATFELMVQWHPENQSCMAVISHKKETIEVQS
jgi:hypothetical protein